MKSKMCLNKLIDFDVPDEGEAWKWFKFSPLNALGYLSMGALPTAWSAGSLWKALRGEPYPLDTWLNCEDFYEWSSNIQLGRELVTMLPLDASCNSIGQRTWYPAGFHAWKYEVYETSSDCIAVRIQYRGVKATGTQRFGNTEDEPVIVAKEMYISSEAWAEALAEYKQRWNLTDQA